MFNLLVMSGRWTGRRDDMPLGRVYITEDQAPNWKDDELPNFAQMKTLPALFCEETWRGGEGQFARVGEITQIRVRDNNVTIDYRYDLDVEPIPQADLIAMAPALDIRTPRRGFAPLVHTHWAIKDADLYRVLMTEWRRPNRAQPAFLLDPPPPVDQNLLSAMMPFAGFDHVWGAIQRSATATGMRSGRADNQWEHPAIIQDIVSLIHRSAIVICDCSGKNPNVFYEMGIAHALGKEVIIITQNAADIPFDIAHLRHIRYHGNEQGIQQLEADITGRLSALRGHDL